MIYGYIRVSTDKQTVKNQRFEIEHFAEFQKIKIDRWIEETVSGTVAIEKRKLGGLLKRLKTGDILIAAEISRLGRNLLQIMSILHHCMNIGCQVWTIKDNYRLGTDIQSKVLAFAFGLSAEIERNLISQRTKEALLRLKKEGKHLGRPFGQKCAFAKLRKNKDKILKLYQQNVPKTHIARLFKVNRNTIRRLINSEKKNCYK